MRLLNVLSQAFDNNIDLYISKYFFCLNYNYRVYRIQIQQFLVFWGLWCVNHNHWEQKERISQKLDYGLTTGQAHVEDKNNLRPSSIDFLDEDTNHILFYTIIISRYVYDIRSSSW